MSGGYNARRISGERPKTLLVAATGGHLEQLYRIRPRLEPVCGEVLWVTHDDPQTRSLLAGERVWTVPYVPPRGYRELVRIAPIAWRILNEGRFDRIISTGAGIAIPFIAEGRQRNVECHYIESAARANGPSFTGRVVSRMPGVHLYSQYASWAHGAWNYRGLLFDSFGLIESVPPAIHRVVVTLGTMRTYGFRRAVERLAQVLPTIMPERGEVLWQLGVTDGRGLSGDVRTSVPNTELREAIGAADLVVAHSGIGSALTALEMGKRPVLLPRRAQFHEHVDDHQALIAADLERRGLAVMAEAGAVTGEQLLAAASGSVVRSDSVDPFLLVGSTHRRHIRNR